MRYLYIVSSPQFSALVDIPNTILTENVTCTHAHTHARTNKYNIHTHTHIYRQVKCGCGLIVLMPAIVLAYISVYNLSPFILNRDESSTRERFFSKKTNKNKEEINVANQFFPCRDMSRDLDIPWWHTYRSRKSLHSQTKTKTFGPSSSKSKRKGKKSRCSPPFSLSFFIYVYIYIYPFLSLTLLFSSLSLSLSLARPFSPRLIDGQHSREHRALVLHCIWWYVYEYWLRVWRYI